MREGAITAFAKNAIKYTIGLPLLLCASVFMLVFVLITIVFTHDHDPEDMCDTIKELWWKHD